MKFLSAVLVLVALLFLAGCKKKHADIILTEAAFSVWDDNVTLGTQLQLQNAGKEVVRELKVTEVDIQGGSYQGPAPLPTASLGDLGPGKDVLFDAILKVAAADGSARQVEVEGTCRVDGKERHFRAERKISPSSAPIAPIPVVTGTAVKQNPNTVTYPPEPTAAPFGPNSEQPIFIPIGPPRQIFPPTPTGTGVSGTPGGAGVIIPRNTTSRNAGVPPDPNAAAATADGVVITTYNSNLSYSKDGGQTFTDVNLTGPQPGNPARTTFFPQNDGGFCCDQVVIYLPNQNLFCWLLQYNPIVNGSTITQTSRLRVAWATPSAVASDFWNAWSYIDLTGTGLGTTNAEWLDYPDLAWSDTFLYVAIDHGNTTPGRVYTGRRIVARLSLGDITNAAATSVGYGYAELTGANGLNKSHMIQGAPARLVLGSLKDSSTLMIFTLKDNENSVTSSTVGVTQIQQTTSYTSAAPDNADWLSVSFPGNITGGVYRKLAAFGGPPQEQYLFAFDAGVNASKGRPRAYLRLETLAPDGNNYKASEEYDVWNNDYAFAMGALGTDGQQIGITLAVGGGTLGYPQDAVGYKDDFVVYQVTNSNATQTVRFGDYFCNRPIAGGLFASEVYDVTLKPLPPGVTSGTCATVGCIATMRFVEYGRPTSTPPPIK